MPQEPFCYENVAPTHKSKKTAFIALGGNLTSAFGEPVDTIIAGIKELGRTEKMIRSKSKFYKTPAFPPTSGNDYVNAIVKLYTHLGPNQLLSVLHDIESNFGRERRDRWGARTLDLDLIAYEDLVIPDLDTHQQWLDLPLEAQKKEIPDQLILPHPRMQDRAFVLVPMHDVAPDWVHPVLGRSVRQMLSDLPDAEKEQVIPVESGL